MGFERTGAGRARQFERPNLRRSPAQISGSHAETREWVLSSTGRAIYRSYKGQGEEAPGLGTRGLVEGGLEGARDAVTSEV